MSCCGLAGCYQSTGFPLLLIKGSECDRVVAVDFGAPPPADFVSLPEKFTFCQIFSSDG